MASFIWPLALPACLLFTLITMLVFSLQTMALPSSYAHDAGMC
ncbi:putative membrane protein [Escherichia coli MP020980.2]|nr:putative membrane protein [Escherichia coli MP020980.2]